MRWLLKRWWFWAGTAFIVSALAAGYLLIPASNSRVSQATCDRIRLGMTSQQVEAVLDGPEQVSQEVWRLAKGGVRIVFHDEDGNAISLEFGKEDRVKEYGFIPTTISFPERLRRRIERRIRAIWP